MNTIDILTWLDEHVDRGADLCLDSRDIGQGDVFFACPGIATDGRQYMAAAVQAGAAAIVADAGGSDPVPARIPVLEVPGLQDLLGEIAHLWYGRPSDALAVVAVTGTNGKTSTTQWLAAAMNAEDMPCGTIGTLGVTLPDGRNLGGVLTTPDVLTLHRSLAAIRRAGGVAAAIEASSIGIAQGRLDGVRIQVAGWTNLTRDHLDYHDTFECYKQAKFALFEWPGLRGAVINADDPAGAELLQRDMPASKVAYSRCEGRVAAFRAEDIQHGSGGLVFNLATPGGSVQMLTRLVGTHNISNLLLVAGVLRTLGWGLSRTARALGLLTSVPGRLQVVTALGGTSAARPQAQVVVDYAHTPDALERALDALRPMARNRGGRLICVFGCGGDRDHGKRPLMGAAAAAGADGVVVTTDNPRTESPRAIIDEIVAGMPDGAAHIEVDRATAILETIWRADEKDVILLAGKGHETYQEAEHIRRPFDDREWARFALSWQLGARLSTDTRTLRAGDWFLALTGPHFDGHDYVEAARDAGAYAALVAHRVEASPLPQIVLGNTREALKRIASVWRRQFRIPVIAVTGSNGKTTTKEMVSAILAAWWGEAARLSTLGNFNNDIGLPLTVLRLNPAHRAAVFELGMNHPGEIAVLAAIARPTVALVNNAQREHQEFMSSVEAVARENGAVLSALPQAGVAVFPGDEPYTGLWRSLAGERTTYRFGFAADMDVTATQIHAASDRTEFRLQIGRESSAVALHAPGRHNLRNALAAAACAHAAGAPLSAIVNGLEAFAPVGGRMRPHRLADGFQLIDDSYNANPDSVRAAIEVLSSLGGRCVLVLGDMAEVGDQGPAMHAEVGAYARECGVTALLAIGPLSEHAVQAFGDGAHHFERLEDLLPHLLAERPAHMLVKGSRSMRMERVVRALDPSVSAGGGAHAA